MDLDFTEEQEMLRDMARGVLAEHASLDVVRAMEDDATGYPKELWAKLAEQGLCGIFVPEGQGGSDQSILEGAILYEELGRSLAPTPHFGTAALGALLLRRHGSEAQKAAWLPRIASGDAILSVAWLEANGGFGPGGVQLKARRDGDGYVLSGSKWHAQFASSADRLIVPVRIATDERAIDLLLVDPRAKGVSLEQQLTLGSDTQYEVRFEDVRVAASDRIGDEGAGWAAWEDVALDGMILLAAQAVGGARRSLELAVDYAKERKQFDKPIGAFQAISHYLADRATEVEGGATLVYEAAWARAENKPVGRLAPMAKLFASQVYRDTTATAEQVFGGVGFTLEYDIQLYFRRAKQLQLGWWDARDLEERVASAVLD